MLHEIKSLGGEVLCSCEADSFKECVELAVKNDADLRDADLSGADLSGADLRGADLRGANLSGADLYGADLRGADLSCADLRDVDLCDADLDGADLRGAKLYGAKLNWQSHALLSHLLMREAGNDIDRRFAAGIVAVSIDWCWHKFLNMDHPAKKWVLETLVEYIVERDEHPKALDVYRKEE